MFRIALPAAVASLAVLAIGGVGTSVWAVQVIAIALALAMAAAGPRVVKRVPADILTLAIIVLTLAMLAMTAPAADGGPRRWSPLGSLRLYVAPVWLPVFVWAVSACVRAPGRGVVIASAAALGVALLLARQPDASQVLALVAAMSVVLIGGRTHWLRSAFVLAVIAMIAAWTFRQPDPLLPVPYVEGVFALAWGRSMLIGLAVIASAVALVAGLQVHALRGHRWASAVASYYAVLFGCSVMGLTPAPLIGFGAGPWLGFGLLMAVARRESR